MGSIAAIQAIGWLLGSLLMASPTPAYMPLVDRPQVEAAGLTIYWQRGLSLARHERIQRIERVEENLYVITDQGQVIAIDAATGVHRWSTRLASPGIRIKGPTHGGDTAWFTTLLGIHGLSRATGESRLQWKGDFAPTGPASTDGQVLYVGTSTGRVAAIRLRDTQILWQVMTDGLVDHPPILLGTNVYFVSEGGKIYGAAKSDKTRLWPIKEVGTVRAWPAAFGGRLFVASQDQSLYSFDMVTGQLAWQTRTPAPLLINPKVTSFAVYQPIQHHGLFVVDPAAGQIRWTLPEGVDLLAEHENLVWLMTTRCSLAGCDKADGQVRQEIPCRADIWVPNDVDDAIFLASSYGQLACVRPAGAGFLRYRTVLETAARAGSTQPAAPGAAAQDVLREPPPAPPVDYLRSPGTLPPVSGSSPGAPAPQPEQ